MPQQVRQQTDPPPRKPNPILPCLHFAPPATHWVLKASVKNKAEWAPRVWREECVALKEELERRYDIEITDEMLRDATRVRNRLRKGICEMYELQMNEPPAMWGVEMMTTLAQNTFNFDVNAFVGNVEKLVEERKGAYEAGERPVPATAKRILLTGCPSSGVIQKVGMSVERNGGVIVALDDCGGERTQKAMVDPEAEDIMGALAQRYLDINCSVMTPNSAAWAIPQRCAANTR